MFYAARILESMNPESIHKIVEFGGGYGCLAHIFNSIIPHATIYLIDIPELLAIQYVYLKNALPYTKIYKHIDDTSSLSDPGIHLIPTYLLQQLDIDADLFVSNFALSEAPAQAQTTVAQKNFFNAATSYITGQLDNQGEYAVEHHRQIHSSIRSSYRHVRCQPFHFFFTGVHAYELLAQEIRSIS
jgi:putative sugar O-methyltransferase